MGLSCYSSQPTMTFPFHSNFLRVEVCISFYYFHNKLPQTKSKLLFYNSGVLHCEIGLPGLMPMCQQDYIPSRGSREISVSLPFPASRSYSPPVCDPIRLGGHQFITFEFHFSCYVYFSDPLTFFIHI